MSDKVNCFLIGAQKSGSTALAKYIEQIDDVCVSSPKATNYFNSLFNKSFQVSTYDEYKKAFTKKNVKYYCDASDCYHADVNALIKIKQYNENAKVIFITRNISNMIESLHEHLLWAGYQDCHDLNEAWFNGYKASGKYKSYLDYKWISSIGTQAKIAFDLFGDNLIIVNSAELRNNPLHVVNKICDFLEVDQLDKVDKVVANESVRSKSKLISTINNVISPKIKTWVKLKLNSKGVELDGVIRKLNKSKKPKAKIKTTFNDDIELHVQQQNKILSQVMSYYESNNS